MSQWIMCGLVGMAMVVAAGAPAWADSTHICQGNSCNNAGGQGGHATATSTNVNVQSQGQQQSQGQLQGQGQVQGQQANNAGNSQSVKVESGLIPGVAVAPGLAAGGSQVCLGSFSVGLSGPMAGLAFGKTVVDKGCEDRQHAILLFNMGYAKEALELLKAGNERVRAVMGGQVTKASITAIPDLTLSTPLGQAGGIEGTQAN